MAEENQREFKRSGTAGKCIEARELIIALPEEYQYIRPNEVLKKFTDFFKEKYGVECAAALHHNKRKTNYHIHLIFSERRELPEPEVKIASRNMFYDETGKHCRTKKEILDADGNVRKGCFVVKKGEPYSGQYFTAKEKIFKSKEFVQEVKEDYTELINEQLMDEKKKLAVYKKDSIYLPMKKIGRNNPKADIIIRNNKEVAKWNYTAAYVATVMSEAHVKEIKRSEIIEPVKTSVNVKVDNSIPFDKIVNRAVRTMGNVLKEWMRLGREDKPEANSDMFRRMIDYCRSKLKSRYDRER